MKTQQCISNLSVAVTGLLIGITPAMALPLLDSDLASFTTLGASSERSTPKYSGEGTGGQSGSVQAYGANKTSAGYAGLGSSQHEAGAAGIGLAQALHSPGIFNPGREAPARLASIKDPLAETGNLPRSPARDKRDDARRYLCAMAQANLPVAAFDPDLCKEISTPNDIQTIATAAGVAGKPPLEQAPPPSNEAGSNRDADKLTEYLQRALLPVTSTVESGPNPESTGKLTEYLQPALLLVTSPVDSGSNPESAGNEPTGSPIPLSSPDIAAAFAISPTALDINELAATVPEPATLALLAFGLAGIGVSRKRPA